MSRQTKGVGKNRVDDVDTGSPHWYISYNSNTSVQLYGCKTTALVLGQMEYFLVLNGDHREAFRKVIASANGQRSRLDLCLAYVRDNQGKLSHRSDAVPSTPPDRTTIWRVRQISFDGGRLGRELSAEFFFDEQTAASRLMQLIAEYNERNSNYPCEVDQEELEGVRGYCNWRFGDMFTMDSVEVK